VPLQDVTGNGLAGVGQYALKIPATQIIRSFEGYIFSIFQ